MAPPGFESAGSEIRREEGAGPASSALLYESGHDAQLWGVLAATNDAQQFCQSWLAIQCRLIPAVEGGLVLLLIESEGSYAPAAVWPDVRRDMSYLTHAAQRALVEQRGLVMPASAANAAVRPPVVARLSARAATRDFFAAWRRRRLPRCDCVC